MSTDFNITGGSCGSSSPRVEIQVDTNGDGVSDGRVRALLGPSPSFTGCTSGWQNSGNLIGNPDTGRFNYSAFGGSSSTTYSDAPASVITGKVVGVAVIADGYLSPDATLGGTGQIVLVDNINLNGDITTFEFVFVRTPQTLDECFHGGWEFSVNPYFKNLGDCVSFIQSHKNQTDN